MKLKIIFPANDRLVSQRVKAAPAPPLSLEYLAGLAPADAEVELLDMGHGDVPDYADPAEGGTDLVAIHVRTPVASTAFRVADGYRKNGVKVAMGGPHPTLLPQECKAHSDAVCIGEGEEAWPALLNDLTKDDLRDYYVGGPYKVGHLKGRVRKFASRPDLKNLSTPRRNLFPAGRYKLQGVFVSRGCPYDCCFCSVRNLQGARVRLRPQEEVLEEISGIEGPIFFAEENATGIPATSDYFRSLFRGMAGSGVKRSWAGASPLGMAADRRGRRVLEAAADSGYCFAFIGFETLSMKTADSAGVLGKLGHTGSDRFDERRLEELVRVFYDLGVYVMGYFIVGFDEDTEETFKRIIDFCDRTMVLPMFTVLAPMPGTRLYEEYLEGGRFRKKVEWDDFGSDSLTFRHPRFSGPKLNRLYNGLWAEAYTPERMVARLDFARKTSPRAFGIAYETQLNIMRAFLQKG
jgi:radical SAM superfamily enzyme YgiQ (UPF0313 family)